KLFTPWRTIVIDSPYINIKSLIIKHKFIGNLFENLKSMIRDNIILVNIRAAKIAVYNLPIFHSLSTETVITNGVSYDLTKSLVIQISFLHTIIGYFLSI